MSNSEQDSKIVPASEGEAASGENGPLRPECPEQPRFQFSLGTLLLLFVVLGSSLAVFGSFGIVVLALSVGFAFWLNRAESISTVAYSALMLMFLIFAYGVLLPAIQSSCECSRRCQCANNVKQIALALLTYREKNGCFPPAYIADKNGKPMHSWRVLILPYMDEQKLYNAYDFSQPWDGPKNKLLLAQCPYVYKCPSEPNTRNSGITSYVAVVGAKAEWIGDKPRDDDDLDRSSETVLVTEMAASGIAWSEPRDLSQDAFTAAEKSQRALLPIAHRRNTEFFFTNDHNGSVHVAMADGSVQNLVTAGRSNEELRKILEIGGCTNDVLEDAVYNARQLNWPNIDALVVWILSEVMLMAHAVKNRPARRRV